MTEKLLNSNLLYFIPSRGEFLKIQPGTGDNLLREDRALGSTDYVLWSTFKPLDLGIDGELDMECLDSGMVMIKGIPDQARNVDGMPDQVRHDGTLSRARHGVYVCSGGLHFCY